MGFIDVYIMLIIVWHVVLIGMVMANKHRVASASLLLSTLLFFSGIKIISLKFPTDDIYQQIKRDEFTLAMMRSKEPVVLNIAPAMWLTKIDARGEGNMLSLEHRKKIGGFFPIGSAPNVKTFYCSEDEGFISYKTDKFGFRNPNVIWETTNHNILILGDSFAESACVETPLQTYFSDEKTVVSLGKGGNGPLTSLAAMKEYFARNNAKYVYHFVVSNDYSRELGGGYDIDFDRELQDQQLKSYLSSDYDGIGYFSKISLVELLDFAINYSNELGEKNKQQFLKIDFANLYSYGFLRSLFVKKDIKGEGELNTAMIKSRFADKNQLARVYNEMSRVAKLNKSTMVFVLLPDKQSSCINDEKLIFLKTIFSSEKFQILDAWKELCSVKYFAKNGGHFNAAGYERLVDLIQKDIGNNR